MLSIINDDSKTLKVIIIGSMCYIILHAFLFSKYNENSELVLKFREYIYYLFLADAILTGTFVWMFEKPQINESSESDNDANESDSDDNDETESAQIKKDAVINRPPISVVRDKLLALKAQQAAKNEHQSPFVSKNETKSETKSEKVEMKTETKPEKVEIKAELRSESKPDNKDNKDNKIKQKYSNKTDKINESIEDDIQRNDIESENENEDDNIEDDVTIPIYKGTRGKSDEDTMIPVFKN